MNQHLAIEVVIKAGKREDVLTSDGDLDESALDDPSVYKFGVYFKFKARLYHVVLLTEVGKFDGEEALTHEWRLEQPVGRMQERR